MQTILGALAVLGALGAGAWQAHFKAVFTGYGIVGSNVRVRNTDGCVVVSGMSACEKVVLHEATGQLFGACSTPTSRTRWIPAVHHLNASGRAVDDYVTLFDPTSGSVRNLTLSGFTDPRGLNTHGMDVVPATDGAALWVYLINQRPPLAQLTSESVDFPDPSVEVFRMSAITASTLKHVATVAHPLVRSPNDVVGAPDGSAFWVTIDGSHARGLASVAKTWLHTPDTGVVHCTVATGACKPAVEKLVGANGIARASDGDTFFVASALTPELRVLARQADDTLVVTDVVPAGLPQDNLAIDADGAVWAAGMPRGAHRVFAHFKDPAVPSASTALRVTLNTGRSAFFGEKYKVLAALEDDGTRVSGSTTATYDARRGRLFMSGLAADTVMCELPKEKFDLESVGQAAAA